MFFPLYLIFTHDTVCLLDISDVVCRVNNFGQQLGIQFLPIHPARMTDEFSCVINKNYHCMWSPNTCCVILCYADRIPAWIIQCGATAPRKIFLLSLWWSPSGSDNAKIWLCLKCVRPACAPLDALTSSCLPYQDVLNNLGSCELDEDDLMLDLEFTEEQQLRRGK